MDFIEIFFICVYIIFACTLIFGFGYGVYDVYQTEKAIEEYCLSNNYQFKNYNSNYGPICYDEINNTIVTKLVPKEVYE